VLSFPPRDSPWEGAGWSAYFSDMLQDAEVLVRFGRSLQSETEAGAGGSRKFPLVIREVLIRAGASESAGPAVLMRELPLARMEVAANRRLLRLPPPETASEYPFVNFDPHISAPPALDEAWARRPVTWEHEDESPPLRLTVPAERRKPDSFYADAADRYLWLASQGRRPATALADANGVPVTTVHRWIKEARQRGILPPGQRGRQPQPPDERKGTK
jgi:hypothetical protein